MRRRNRSVKPILFFVPSLFVIGAFIFWCQDRTFAAAAESYRGSSEVNAALVRSVARELTLKVAPSELRGSVAAAVKRQRMADDSFRRAVHWALFWPAGELVRFRRAVAGESVALTAVDQTVGELAAREERDWSGPIGRLREEVADYAAAHAVVMRR